MPSVLVLGATGFVGEPLVKALNEAHPEWSITAFVRPKRSAETVKVELGVDRVVTGEFEEFDKIQALSKEHDIVINAGNSFTSEPVAAIVAGLKERPATQKGKLIHISGSGNFIDMGTSGNFNPESKVWSDAREDDIKLVNEKMFNGPSDTVVLEAGKDGSVETYIVCIGPTYGGAALGLKTIGVGYNILIGNAKQLGYVPYVGNGSAVLATTHIVDAINFLTIVGERAARGPADGSVYSRWYNVQTKRETWKELATALAKLLHDKGVLQHPEPKNVSVDEAGEGEIKYLVGSNMLMEGPRAAKMGFISKQPSMLEQMSEDLKDAAL